MNEALFRSVEEALMWAWYFSRYQQGIGPSFARMIKADEREQIDEVRPAYSPTASKPRGLDAAAQAGMIKAFVEALPTEERSHLKAHALRANDRIDAQRTLRDFLLHAVNVKPALAYELIAKHYGKRDVTIAALAEKFKVNRRTVSAIRREIEILLDAIAYRSETKAYDRLQKMGVVL